MTIPEQFLADLAEALGHTRDYDGAPLIMTPEDTVRMVREMRDDASVRPLEQAVIKAACRLSFRHPGAWTELGAAVQAYRKATNG